MKVSQKSNVRRNKITYNSKNSNKIYQDLIKSKQKF